MPNITGTVTIKNISLAMPISEISWVMLESANSPTDVKTINGIVITHNKLIIAVSDTERATSPFAKEVNKLDVTPPGAAAIIITPIANSGAIAAERENVVSYFAQAGLITLVLNVVMMVVAYFVAHLLASGTKQKKCITIECGLQNGTLAIFVATSIFGGGVYVIPAATYSLIMFATSLIFVYLVRKTI